MTLLVGNRTQVVELLVKCCNRSTMLQGCSRHSHLLDTLADDNSDFDFVTESVWVKSARGVWGLDHSFQGKLHCTEDMKDLLQGAWHSPDDKP